MSQDMSTEFMIFRLFLCLVVLSIQLTATQVVLETCVDAELSKQCILTCRTPDNTQIISFFKTSDLLNTLGICLPSGGGCSVSDGSKYYINQTGGVTQFIILSHSKSEAANWRCDYNGAYNDKTLKWAKLPTTILTSTGISANTVVSQESSIPVTVVVGCLYSENAPNVVIQYLPGTGSSVMTCAKSATVCSDPDLSAYDCSKTITSNGATCGIFYTMQLKVSVSNTVNTFQQQLFSPYTIQFQCTTTKNSSGGCKDERVIGIVIACCIGVDVVVVILLLYKRIAISNLFHVENIADNPCQKRMMYVLLFVGVVILVVNCFVAVIVLPPTIILYCKYKEALVIGISFLLIAVCTAICVFFYWLLTVYEWGPRNARCCTCTMNSVESETTKKCLSLTSPVTPDKKEKTNKKNQDKSQDIKQVDAQKNISETKNEVNESETTIKSSGISMNGDTSLTSPVTPDKKEKKNKKNQDKSQDIKQVDAQMNISETKNEVNGESLPDS